jgi:hypothetical protein
MLIIVSLSFVAMFGVAGTFLSIEAKRRNDGIAATARSDSGPELDRATPGSN